MRYDGVSWSHLGTPRTLDNVSNYMRLEVHNGQPFIAFQDTNQAARVFTFRANDWEEVGNLGQFAPSAWTIDLELLDGIPYISYRNFEAVPLNNLRVAKYNGINWEYIGNSVELLIQNSDGTNPRVVSSIAFDPITDEPIIAYISQSQPLRSLFLKVKRFSNGAWQVEGDSVEVPLVNDRFSPKLLFHNNKLIVGFLSNNIPSVIQPKVRILELANGIWSQLGNDFFASTGDSDIGDRFVTLNAGEDALYIAYAKNWSVEGDIVVRRFSENIVSSVSSSSFPHQSIVLYPNPAKDQSVSIDVENDLYFKDYNWVLINNVGQIIRTGTKSKINIEGVLPGIYFVSIFSNSGEAFSITLMRL